MENRPIEAVLAEHAAGLVALPGVVGTAQCEYSGTPCIGVFVAQRTDALLRQMPSTLEGYAVEVQETGEIRALDGK